MTPITKVTNFSDIRLELDLNKVLFATDLDGVIIYEIFKDIPDYIGSYQISTFGRLKSLNYRSSKSKRLMKLTDDGKGYLSITLYKYGKVKAFRVHQLVAIAFLNHKPNRGKSVVNHIDFNKLNNRLENLEIVTQRENANKKHLEYTSKYTGVNWDKALCKWKSSIYFNNKQKFLGYFNSELKASEYYQNALFCIINNKVKDIIVKEHKFSSKYIGVSWHKTNNKWTSSIKLNGKQKHLGSYDNEFEAHLAYQKELKQI